MNRKTVITSIIAALVIAAAILAWLMFGGSAPENIVVKENAGDVKATVTNSVFNRDRDGKKIWEFTVAEAVEEGNKTLMKGVKGSVFRSDGSFIDVTGDRGTLFKKSNDFILEGNVDAVLPTGGKLIADKATWNDKKEIITAEGNVRLYRDGWLVSGDKATTTSAFKNLKMEGNAKLEEVGLNAK